MSDLNQLDREITAILETSWEVFWKDILATVVYVLMIGLSLGLLSGVASVGFALLVRRRRAGEDVGVASPSPPHPKR